MVLSNAKAAKLCKQTSLFSTTDNQCLQQKENWKSNRHHILGRIWSKHSNILNIKWKILKGWVMNRQVFFSHFGVDTYSLCSIVRDMQQDMLKGPPSANRLNTHITHSPSFLICLVSVRVLSWSWHWETDTTMLHVSKCHMNSRNFIQWKWIMNKYYWVGYANTVWQ